MTKQERPAQATRKRNQLAKFRETARTLEANEDEGQFNDALRRMAKAPPPKDEPKKSQR